MKNDKLFKELDRFNKKRALNLYKSIKKEVKNLPPSKDRDDIIAFNLALLLTWGDIQV
jgi:hypothetical protein